MANVVRGFRRIGWVITVPVAAFFILMFFENTKQYSVSGYEFNRDKNPFAEFGGRPISGAEWNVIEMPGIGYAEFPSDVPGDVTAQIVADFIKSPEASSAVVPPLPPGAKLEVDYDAIERQIKSLPQPSKDAARTDPFIGRNINDLKKSGVRVTDLNSLATWEFNVPKETNTLKLAGLVALAIIIPVLTIQTSISVLAWVIRGFKSS